MDQSRTGNRQTCDLINDGPASLSIFFCAEISSLTKSLSNRFHLSIPLHYYTCEPNSV
ncbi:MAG: hypothetical protein AB8B99_16940 [Phormidesmis sp.]